MEPFPDLSTLSDDDLTSLIHTREADEERISRWRRTLHGHIDAMRAEHVRRLRDSVARGDLATGHEPEKFDRPLFDGTGETPIEHELESLDDLVSIPTERLRARIHELEREEDDVSLRRRFLQGQIDLLRAERTRRAQGGGELAVDGLAGILSKGTTGPRRESSS